MKFQIPLFPHPLADFFCSRVIFWDKISYFKRGKGANVLENYALEPKMVQMTQEFRMWGMAGHKRPWWLQMAQMAGSTAGFGWDTSRMVCWWHLDPPKLPSGGPGGSKLAWKGHKSGISGHMMAPNGWISVDLGWIWVGYIQGGLLVTFGPTEISKLPSGCSGVGGGGGGGVRISLKMP